MKKINLIAILILMSGLFFSCGNKQESENNSEKNEVSENAENPENKNIIRDISELEGYENYVSSMGGMLGDDYSFQVAQDAENPQKQVLCLEMLDHRNEEGHAYWQVLTLIDVEVPEDYQWSNFVYLNGEPAYDIIVTYKFGDQNAEMFDDIDKAWRMDTEKGTLTEISTEGVQVANEFGGV